MRKRRQRGFTLVETILAVVILGVAATMAGLYASTSMGTGAAATTDFSDELVLRNALEDITIHYKAEIAAGTMTLPRMVTYVNANHANLVDDPNTGYLTFSDPEGDGTYAPSAVSDVYASGSALLITLTSGDQSLGVVFTE